MAMSLLVSVLCSPSSVDALDDPAWDLLVRQARRSGLLATLHHRLEREGLLSAVPERALAHLISERLLASRHQEAVGWEVARIRDALAPVGAPIVLLKGAAYALAGLPVARGRLFSDIDILVPRGALDDAEAQLMRRGWMSSHLDPYDQRYYRKWTHEIPPLRHIQRRSTIDVHHGILPTTARLHPDPRRLLAAAMAVDDEGDLYVLAPADMVLHSATHLFHDGELVHGLRDLVDLDGLLRYFGARAGFWDGLVDRASAMDLLRPLFYALRYTHVVLGTPIPELVRRGAMAGQPPFGLVPWMDALFGRALAPDHASCRDWLTGAARWLLYVRAHYLRMPLHLLIPHLAYKAFVTPYKERKRTRAETREPPILGARDEAAAAEQIDPFG